MTGMWWCDHAGAWKIYNYSSNNYIEPAKVQMMLPWGRFLNEKKTGCFTSFVNGPPHAQAGYCVVRQSIQSFYRDFAKWLRLSPIGLGCLPRLKAFITQLASSSSYVSDAKLTAVWLIHLYNSRILFSYMYPTAF